MEGDQKEARTDLYLKRLLIFHLLYNITSITMNHDIDSIIILKFYSHRTNKTHKKFKKIN